MNFDINVNVKKLVKVDSYYDCVIQYFNENKLLGEENFMIPFCYCEKDNIQFTHEEIIKNINNGLKKYGKNLIYHFCTNPCRGTWFSLIDETLNNIKSKDIPELKVKCMSNYILHIDDVPKRVTNDRDVIENIIGYRNLTIVEIKEQKNLHQEIDYVIKCKSLTLRDIQTVKY